jgi:hypothetical protein
VNIRSPVNRRLSVFLLLSLASASGLANETEASLFAATRAAAKLKPGSVDLTDPSFDKARFKLFVAPEAIKPLADGERKVTVPSDLGVNGFMITRVLSNPYIPIVPYVLNPKYYLSNNPANAEIVSIGTNRNPGFFLRISNIHCGEDDTLLVQGHAGTGTVRPDDPIETGYAHGVWKVAANGSISPLVVKPVVGNSAFYPCGHLGSCETQHSEVWERAESVNPQLSGAIEDKHGNVWLVHRAEPIGWSVLRFNKDGTEKIVLNRLALNENADNKADWMPPYTLRYDKARDEVIFMHQYWGAGDGAMGLWRINQRNEAREVLRFLTKGSLSKPSANIMPGRFSGIEHGLAVDPQGHIWFSAALAGGGAPAQAYQVIDSIKSLKKLPFSAARTVSDKRTGSDQLPPPTVGSGSPAPLGYQACFDSKGNFFFTGGGADVLRREASSGKLSTWVK